MCMESEIIQFLHADLIEDFAEWSFGKDFKILPSSEKFMDRWNEKHGDLFRLTGSDRYHSTLPKMIDIWKENTWEEAKK